MIHLYSEAKHGKGRGLIVTVAVFAALLLIFLFSLNAAGDRLEAQQKQLVTATLENAAVTCFAVEGRYPPTLDYLTTQYGVAYDQSKYVVLYDIFASNIAPVISVRRVGEIPE